MSRRGCTGEHGVSISAVYCNVCDCVSAVYSKVCVCVSAVYCKACFEEMNNMCTACMNPIDYGDFSDISQEL